MTYADVTDEMCKTPRHPITVPLRWQRVDNARWKLVGTDAPRLRSVGKCRRLVNRRDRDSLRPALRDTRTECSSADFATPGSAERRIGALFSGWS
jgi:hypothetical protein